VRAAALDCVAIESLTLEGVAASADDIALGFCTGTPLRAEIEQRGASSDAVVAIVADAIAERLGTGPITGRMTARLVEAVPHR
jgi:hypothetical protein